MNQPTRNYHPRPCCPQLWPATKRGCQDLREYNGTPSVTHDRQWCLMPDPLACAACGVRVAWGAGYFDDDHPARDEASWVHTCIPCQQNVHAAHKSDTGWHLTQLVRESERLGLYGP